MYITRLEQCRIINFKAVSHSKKKMRKKKKKKNKYNENVLNNVHLSIKRILSEAPGRINLLANESYGQKWKIKNKYTLNSPSFVFDKAKRRSLQLLPLQRYVSDLGLLVYKIFCWFLIYICPLHLKSIFDCQYGCMVKVSNDDPDNSPNSKQVEREPLRLMTMYPIKQVTN